MPMRPAPTYGHRLRGTGLAALCTLLAACGQTGYLYLVMPPAKLPPVTTEPAPAPSAASIPAAPCVMVPTPKGNVAPVAAPFAGTSLAGVPYAPDAMPSEAAPASISDILPACAVFPATYVPEGRKHE
ncbi:MAG TPA: hypothetical protein VGT99_08795 [Gammaproteobacteria bacterium]|nr:hypothetical protein [Gammaproteobacteria bacterium]